MIFFNKYKDKLRLGRQYTTYSGAYSLSEKKIKNESVDKILSKYKSDDDIDGTISIESKFNNKIYPFYDLDIVEHFELFKNVYSDTPYVLFKSSDSHYWGIVDTPYNKFKHVYEDYNWRIINDSKYCKFSKSYGKMYIRGLYENKDRKPIVYEINGKISNNLSIFISKLEKYYNNEALELSILRYKDHDMLLQYNRKLKIKNINEKNS